jgi:hypothetical protein
MAIDRLRPGQKATESIFDRVLNPTLGIFQQPIWRIWRALKEEDIDILSKEGLLDPALLPLAGVFFDQRSRVDPNELFGENIGAQIAGSIATDPLSFLTGGFTASAKVGRNLGSLQGTKALKALGGKGDDAKAALQNLIEETGNAGELRKRLNGVLRGPAGDLEPSDFKRFSKLSKALDGVDDGLDLTAAFATRGQRELGLGLPLLGDMFGAYAPLSKGMQQRFNGSWMNFYFSSVGATYKVLGKPIAAPIHLMGKAGADLPILGPLAKNMIDNVADFKTQWRSGNKSSILLKNIRDLKERTGFGEGGLGPEDLDRLLGEQGTRVATNVAFRARQIFGDTPEGRALAQENDGNLLDAWNGLGREDQLLYMEEVLEQAPAQAALAEQVRSVMGVEVGEFISPSAIQKLLANPQLSARMRAELGDVTAKGVKEFLESSTLADDFRATMKLAPEDAVLPEHARLFLDSRENAQEAHRLAQPEFLTQGDPVKTIMGRLGKTMARWKEMAFRNDVGIEGFEELQTFKNHLVSESQRAIETTSKLFYGKLKELVQESGIDEEVLEKFFLSIQEFSPTSQEFNRLRTAIMGEQGLDAQKKAFEELDHWFEGRMVPSLNYLLSSITENLPEGQLKMFDELFEILGADPDNPLLLDVAGGRASLNDSWVHNATKGEVYAPSSLPRTDVTLDKTFDYLVDTLAPKYRKSATEVIERLRKGGVLSKPIGAMDGKETQQAILTLAETIRTDAGISAKELESAWNNLGGRSKALDSILDKLRNHFGELPDEAFRAGKNMGKNTDKKIAGEIFLSLDAHYVNPRSSYKYGDETGELFESSQADFLGRVDEEGFFVKTTKEELDELPTGAIADEGEFNELRELVVNVAAAHRTIKAWQATFAGDSLVDMPPALFENMVDNIGGISQLVTKTALNPLGEGGEAVHDALSVMRTQLFDQADALGMLPNVVPLGFAHRIKDGRTQRAISQALGGLADSGESEVFSPYVNSLFKRGNRSYTIRELNLLRQQLAEQAGPQAKKAHDVINRALEDANLPVPAEQYRESAVDAMMGHMGNILEFRDHTNYFKAVFESDVARANGLIGGRVVAVFEDAEGARATEKTGALKADVDPEEGQLVLDTAASPRKHPSIGYVIETLDGKRTIISHDLMESGGFTMKNLGKGDTVEEATVDYLRRIKNDATAAGKEGPVSLAEAKALEGHMVSVAPTSVNNAVHKTMMQNTPSAQAGFWKMYDSIHTTMKLFATGLRFPLQFGVANTLSAVPQGMLTGIGGQNMLRGMWTAARILGGPQDAFVNHDEVASLLALRSGRAGANPYAKVFDRGGGRAGAEAIRHIERIAGGAIPEEDLMIEVGKGRSFSVRELVAAMVDAGAWEVRTTGELKNIRSTPEMLNQIRDTFFRPGVTGGAIRTKEAALGFASSTEQFVRLSGMLGALNAGMDLDTAARAVADAMVDYSALTKFEREVMKRGTFFYTFPRKMIPLVMKKGMESPSKTAAFLHSTVNNESLFANSEGRIEMNIGEYRVAAGRLAPQFDAVVTLAAIADILPLDIRRFTGEARPDLPFSPSGVASVMGWHDFFPTEDPLAVSGGDWTDDAIRSNWILKFLFGEKDTILGSRNPNINYSPLELVAKSFLPYRKVDGPMEQDRKIRRLMMTKRDMKQDLKYANQVGDADAIKGAQRAIQRVNRAIRYARSNQHEQLISY